MRRNAKKNESPEKQGRNRPSVGVRRVRVSTNEYAQFDARRRTRAQSAKVESTAWQRCTREMEMTDEGRPVLK